MEWRIGFCGTPSKNFSKKIEKPLDKLPKVWYNKDTKQGLRPTQGITKRKELIEMDKTIVKKLMDIWEDYPTGLAILAIIAVVIFAIAWTFGLMCLQSWIVMLLWN